MTALMIAFWLVLQVPAGMLLGRMLQRGLVLASERRSRGAADGGRAYPTVISPRI
jgi:hypothetical protein